MLQYGTTGPVFVSGRVVWRVVVTCWTESERLSSYL